MRVGLTSTCSQEGAEEFWQSAFHLFDGSYEIDDLGRIWLGADGGGWRALERLEEKLSEDCDVTCSLGPFHIMQKICRDFPDGSSRDWAASLAAHRKPLRHACMCGRIAPKIKNEKRLKRLAELKFYMKTSPRARFPRPSFGTMEGANAYVGAARHYSIPGDSSRAQSEIVLKRYLA